MHPFYIEFLLTRLLRGATTDGQGANNYIGVSTHTPLARRDKDSFLSSGISIPFLLTRLLRGATSCKANMDIRLMFLLTRLLRGATYIDLRTYLHFYVSTHTPLARRDSTSTSVTNILRFLLTRLLRGATHGIERLLANNMVSTHTPLARRDTTISFAQNSTALFLLTRLLRGATAEYR